MIPRGNDRVDAATRPRHRRGRGRALRRIEVEHLEIPSPHTPGAMKGLGEGGTNGAFACVVNGVAAALPEVAHRIGATPLTPPRVWALLHGD